MTVRIPTFNDVLAAERIIRQYLSPAPLIRSYALEQKLNLAPERRVWLKDYGWTPVGSFKLLGAINWVANHRDETGDRPIAAHSSGNFACGIAFAGMKYGKRVIIVMPDTAPRRKLDLVKSLGAEVRTYNIATDHETGERDRLTREISEQENALQASPYDDPYVIAGNGVGGLEVVEELQAGSRVCSHFVCAVSGGGLMAGHALAISDGFPDCRIIGVEPDGAADFHQSLKQGRRVRIEHPKSICDGLLSYDVGEHNWPILKQHVKKSVCVTDDETRKALGWLYDQHGLRAEPSGVVTLAAILNGHVATEGEGDIVLVVSGRNVDEVQFQQWIS